MCVYLCTVCMYVLGLERRLKCNLRTFVDKMHRRFEASVLHGLQLFDKFTSVWLT